MRLITQALEFGHNLGIHRWAGRLFPYSHRWWFPPLASALSAAASCCGGGRPLANRAAYGSPACC